MTLGGFTLLGSMMGRAAARSIEADAYSLLVSNPDAGFGQHRAVPCQPCQPGVHGSIWHDHYDQP